ncbi:MAG TPA: hypothetical protein VGV38_11780 [Pyrinomonadaceae bacterium]|nr:hypothetical protein [Pyrinomonadaceae bacterium]
MSNSDGAAGGRFIYRSSISDDVWHADDAPGAYEWWYFDAASDDGRDALVVIFLADFVFSPRFNRRAAEHRRGRAAGASSVGATGDADTVARPTRFPAVTVCLYRDGRTLLRAVNEYEAGEFDASTVRPACRVGRSSFHLESSEGRNVFRVSLDEPLRGGRRLIASLAWDVSEGGLTDAGGRSSGGGVSDLFQNVSAGRAHEWNLVAPRCRVEGSLSVEGRGGAREFESGFRGTGYHDHNRDGRWLPETVGAWHWGRAHFAGSAAVFYSYRERGARETFTRLFLVRGGALASEPARLAERGTRRNLFGLRYARELLLEGEETRARLSVRQSRVVDASFFYLRFLGEVTLEDGSGPPRTAPAITELLAPRALRWRWLDWLTDMRIGRNGRSALLK